MSKKPTVLMILDGYGLNDKCEANAVCEGKTPVMDQLMSQCPFVKGNASGMAVGLPEGQIGNSEFGHLNTVSYTHLLKHVSNIKNVYKLPCVVAINAFPTDTKAELDLVEEKCKELGVNVALSEVCLLYTSMKDVLPWLKSQNALLKWKVLILFACVWKAEIRTEQTNP